MARGGNQPISAFLAKLLLPDDFADRKKSSDPREDMAQEAIDWLANDRDQNQNFWPALTLAFIAQIESYFAARGLTHLDDFVDRAERAPVLHGKTVRQLTLIASAGGKKKLSNRVFYNAAEDVIRSEMRRSHPSMPGHATGAWPEYKQLIDLLAATTPHGRLIVAQHVWKVGVTELPEIFVTASQTRQPRPFLELINKLDRGSGTTGGAIYQGIVFGYLSADSPTLTVTSQKVNTGSSRAKVIGDVNGYLGENVVLAAEAKDKDLTMEVHRREIEAFVEDVTAFPDLDAVIFARSFDEQMQSWLDSQGIRTVSHDQMVRTVGLWDIPKQENAVRGLRHFVGVIQRGDALLNRVVSFIDSLEGGPRDSVKVHESETDE